MGVRLFSQVANDRRGNGLQYHHERLRCWKKNITENVFRQWNKFPRKEIESPPLEVFKKIYRCSTKGFGLVVD